MSHLYPGVLLESSEGASQLASLLGFTSIHDNESRIACINLMTSSYISILYSPIDEVNFHTVKKLLKEKYPNIGVSSLGDQYLKNTLNIDLDFSTLFIYTLWYSSVGVCVVLKSKESTYRFIEVVVRQ